MDEGLVSRRVKEFRLQKFLSLEKLAELTGLTKGYLSRIENSKKPPPIFTLSKISQALGMDINSFFYGYQETPPQAKEISVSRKKERARSGERETPYGYVYEALAWDKAGKNMEPYVVYAGFERKLSFQHEGEELLFVLEGRLKFFFGEETLVLEEGDSLYFDAQMPHCGVSLGDRSAKLLVVIYSYRRVARPLGQGGLRYVNNGPEPAGQRKEG